MQQLQVFKSQEFGAVRVIEKGGEPWFVAKDVCEILEIGNTTDAVNRLSHTMKATSIISTQFGDKETNIISEPGLYKLVFTSRKPEAEKFTDWVASEVIPSIRKHGAYVTPDKLEEMLTSPDFTIRLLTEIKAEREKRQEIERTAEEMRPKTAYYDLVLQCKSLLTTTQISKEFGVSAKRLNELLSELGVQYKVNSQWVLYQKYANKGYTQSKTHIIDAEKSAIHTYWTQKGRIFIYDTLKEKGILPLIEQDAQMKILDFPTNK